MSGRKLSPVRMQGEAKSGRSAYKVECLLHCNDEAIKCMLNYVSRYNDHLQGMTYNLLQYGEEIQDVSRKNSQLTEIVSIYEDSCD